MWANIDSLSGDDEAINMKFDLQEKNDPLPNRKGSIFSKRMF